MTDEASVRAARDAYHDALDSAYLCACMAFDAVGSDSYENASRAFAIAYEQLNASRDTYFAELEAAINSTQPELKETQ